MASGAVRTDGLRELIAAFRKIDKALGKELGDELKKVAEPVTTAARAKVGRFRGSSARTIRPRRSGANVYVEQGARKVTGRRGDFGALQMREVLIPALDENRDAVIEGVDDFLGRLAGEAGF